MKRAVLFTFFLCMALIIACSSVPDMGEAGTRPGEGSSQSLGPLPADKGYVMVEAKNWEWEDKSRSIGHGILR